MKYYLITWVQVTGGMNSGYKNTFFNTVSVESPGNWLADKHDNNIVLIGSVEISKQEYERLNNVL